MQPDARFFRADCDVLPVVQSSSSAAGDEDATTPAELLDDVHDRPHRPGRGGLASVEGGDFEKPTPELLDLLRLRKQAKEWNEYREDGQGEFIWFIHNSGKYIINVDDCIEFHCKKNELKVIKSHRDTEWRNLSFSAGDIGFMFTAKWARMFMRALAAALLVYPLVSLTPCTIIPFFVLRESLI